MQDKSVRAAWYLGANKCRPSLLNATRWSLEGHYHWWETRHTEIAITPMVRTVQHMWCPLCSTVCIKNYSTLSTSGNFLLLGFALILLGFVVNRLMNRLICPCWSHCGAISLEGVTQYECEISPEIKIKSQDKNEVANPGLAMFATSFYWITDSSMPETKLCAFGSPDLVFMKVKEIMDPF